MTQDVDLFGEERMTLQELSRELNIHFSTAWRWALKGIKGVRLPTRVVGAKRITTREAFERWSDELTRLRDGGTAPVPMSTSRRRRFEETERELKELGCH